MSTTLAWEAVGGAQPDRVALPGGPVEWAEYGRGPAVLCLHGAMGGYDQALILACTVGGHGWRWLAPSRPGYLGTPLAGRRTPEAQADLHAAFLDRLQVDRVAVVAISGGGPGAIHFALRHMDRCAALVLISTPVAPVDNRLPLSFKLAKVLMRLPGLEALARRKLVRAPEKAAARAITDPARLQAILADPEAWALLQALQLSTVDRMVRRLAGTDVDVAQTRTGSYPLERIGVPTLVVQGDRDPLVPLAAGGHRAARLVPGAELRVLEGGGHAAIFSHRREARAAVTGFLDRHAR